MQNKREKKQYEKQNKLLEKENASNVFFLNATFLLKTEK